MCTTVAYIDKKKTLENTTFKRLTVKRWYFHRESNPDQRFRKPTFYPLNYGSPILQSIQTTSAARIFQPPVGSTSPRQNSMRPAKVMQKKEPTKYLYPSTIFFISKTITHTLFSTTENQTVNSSKVLSPPSINCITVY